MNERQKRAFGWLAVATILGVGILVLQPSAPSPPINITPSKPETPNASLSSVGTKWEQELEYMLNTMLGGKRSKVFLTLERGPKINIAYNVTEEERQTVDGATERKRTATPVILRNDGERKETPLILEEIEPIVRGVLVIVEYQPYAQLRLQIAQAVATVLQVPMYRIEVLFKQ